MSASREKKERQGIESQGLTQKQKKEAQEANAAKHKKIIYWAIGIVSVALIAALLVWNSGFFQRRTTAATIGSETITLSEMQYYYSMVRNSELQNQQMYAQYGISILTAPYVTYDTKSELGDQQFYNTETSQTYAEHFREGALKSATQVTALVGAAEDEGYTLSADGKSTMNAQLKDLKKQVADGGFPSFSSYLTQAYGKYVTESVFTGLQTKASLASEYQTHHQDALTYSEEQLVAYEKKNPAELFSYDFRYCYIEGTPAAKSDAEGKSVEATEEEKAAALAAAKAKADALVSGVKAAAGDKSEAFNKLVVDAVGADSTYADPEYNLNANILGSNLKTSAYYEWLSDTGRKPGDITAVENTGSGYFVVLYLKSGLDTTPTVDVRHILIKPEAVVDDAATADVDESAAAPTAAALEAAKAKAQGLLDEFNALPADQKTAEAFGKLAAENTEDTGSSENGGLYRYVEVGSMVPNFDAWIFDSARKSGDTGLVENVAEGSTYYGYHVMYYVGENGPKWHDLAEKALKAEDMAAWVESVEAPYTAAWTEGGAALGK